MLNRLTSHEERPVHPRDCSLLIGVPLDKERFVQDLDPDSAKDFVKQFRKGRECLSANGLWRLYEPYANLALDVAEEASKLGVNVIYNARSCDFSSQLIRREVTTVVAHWRSPLFRCGDVVSAKLKANEIDEQFKRVTGFSCRNDTCEEIAAKLNMFLEDGWAYKALNAGSDRVGVLTRKIYALHKKRQSLERQIPNVFEGGSSVEFSDGLFSIHDVVRAVPADFAGILDLTVCNSIMLGEEIRKKCDDCVVIINEKAASFDFRFALYRQIIRSLSRNPQSFLDVVIGLRKQLAEVLKGEKT